MPISKEQETKILTNLHNHSYTPKTNDIYNKLVELGIMYYDGKGREKNIKQALFFFEKAVYYCVDHKIREATYYLGKIYFEGFLNERGEVIIAKNIARSCVLLSLISTWTWDKSQKGIPSKSDINTIRFFSNILLNYDDLQLDREDREFFDRNFDLSNKIWHKYAYWSRKRRIQEGIQLLKLAEKWDRKKASFLLKNPHEKIKDEKKQEGQATAYLKRDREEINQKTEQDDDEDTVKGPKKRRTSRRLDDEEDSIALPATTTSTATSPTSPLPSSASSVMLSTSSSSSSSSREVSPGNASDSSDFSDVDFDDDEPFIDLLKSPKKPPTKKKLAVGKSISQPASVATQSDATSSTSSSTLKKESKKKEKIGPRAILGWILEDVDDEGNCFYDAVVHQMVLINHPFLENAPVGTARRDSLRLYIQGAAFKDEEWADHAEIATLARKLNCIVAIVDTRYPTQSFVYHYIDSDGNAASTPHSSLLLSERAIFRLAFTGDHYLSVVKTAREVERESPLSLLASTSSSSSSLSSTTVSSGSSVPSPLRKHSASVVTPSIVPAARAKEKVVKSAPGILKNSSLSSLTSTHAKKIEGEAIEEKDEESEEEKNPSRLGHTHTSPIPKQFKPKIPYDQIESLAYSRDRFFNAEHKKKARVPQGASLFSPAKNKKRSSQKTALIQEAKDDIGRWGEKYVFDQLQKHYLDRYPGAVVTPTPDGFRLNGKNKRDEAVEVVVTWYNKEEESGESLDLKLMKTKDSRLVKTRYIEVKTTQAGKTNTAVAHFTAGEIQMMQQFGDQHTLYRVYGAGSSEVWIEKTRNLLQSLDELNIEAVELRI